MPGRDLSRFQKGVQIALENILNHYLRKQDMSLLEVVEVLGNKVPVIGGKIDDWERMRKLDGGLWVCDVVRGMWERLLEEYGLVEVEN